MADFERILREWKIIFFPYTFLFMSKIVNLFFNQLYQMKGTRLRFLQGVYRMFMMWCNP